MLHMHFYGRFGSLGLYDGEAQGASAFLGGVRFLELRGSSSNAIQELRAQKPCMVWVLGPSSVMLLFLDPLGKSQSFQKPSIQD